VAGKVGKHDQRLVLVGRAVEQHAGSQGLGRLR
jgi:hypothetical protein